MLKHFLLFSMLEIVVLLNFVEIVMHLFLNFFLGKTYYKYIYWHCVFTE